MRPDAIISGGSFAWVSAATYVARARRSVCIVDKGPPGNHFAAHAHGFFAQDGSEPGAMLATARSQVAAYPTVPFIAGEAVGVARKADGLPINLATGEVIEVSKLVLAFGIAEV